MISIRKYKKADAHNLWTIFYNTIHNVNIQHYSQEEVNAWAPAEIESEIWQKRMDSILPFIAEINGEIVGYADLQKDGLIDHFFCHDQHQGKGIGRCLMEHLLNVGRSQEILTFYSEVSITARPFYEKFGFKVLKEQLVEVRGQKLRNFVMEKFR